MRKENLLGGNFNTLAQSWTGDCCLEPKIVVGNGSKVNNRAELRKKAKRKVITHALILNLIDISRKKNEPEVERSLWNTYHCQSKLISSDKRTYGKYCKNRFCLVCLGIRKAEIINKYYPTVSKWEDPYFVTLTVKACPAKRLHLMMDGMVRAFQKIKDRNKKRYRRGKGIKLIGVRSLECNFNPVSRTYNPHFHIIVPDKETAIQLKKDWLNIWTKDYCAPWCQDIRKVSSVEGSLIEIIKYGTKIFTEPNGNSKVKKKASPKVYVSAMYNILSAMRHHRLFERFGFNLPQEPIIKIMPKKLLEYDLWTYDSRNADWFSEQTGQVLANYIMDVKLKHLLSNNIDTIRK